LGEIPSELLRYRETSIYPHRVRAAGEGFGAAAAHGGVGAFGRGYAARTAVGGGAGGNGDGTGGAPFVPQSARPEPQRAAQAAGLSTGDKVVHAKFGEGVVLGMEPGGIVRVFFSELGEQKRLLLEYAPLKRV